MHRLLILSLFLTALIVIPAQRADACSCALLPVDQMLEIHDAAFIGTLTEVSAPIGQGQLGEEAIYTFEVEQWLVGDGESAVGVRSSTSGASCGFEVPMGQRVAVFLSAGPGGFTGGLCSTMDADVVLAGLIPLTVESSRPPAAVVFGGQGNSRLIVVDAGGQVTALLPTDGDDNWVADVSTCPGGANLIEAAGSSIIVRSVADLSQVAAHAFGEDRGIMRVWCLSADGTDYIAMANVWTGTTDESILFDELDEVFVRARFGYAEVVGDKALIVFDEGERVSIVDLSTGDQTDVYLAKRPSGGFGGVEGLARNGSLVAFHSTVYANNGPIDSELAIVDVETATLVASRPLDFDALGVTWLGTQTLAVSGGDGTLSRTYQLPDLAKVTSVAWPVWTSAVFGNGALAVASGTLLLAHPDGSIETVRTFPSQGLYGITAVDASADISPDVPQPVPTTTTTTTPATTPPVAGGPSTAGSTPVWPWAVGAASLVAVAALALRKRSA
ncbi:MAG: hypothetical protein OEO77_02750 [Acidimicrobiia bacterium]|nr:hypothetical protein [Acidimicrobiia bacterium]